METFHIFYCRSVSFSGDVRAYQRAVGPTGTLQTERIDVDGSVPHAFQGAAPLSHIIMRGELSIDRAGTVKCRATYNSTGNGNSDVAIMAFDAADDPSSFTTTVLAADGGSSGGANHSLTAIDDVLYCVYGKSAADSDMNIEDDSGTDTWTGSPTVVTNQGTLIGPISIIANALEGKAVISISFREDASDPWYDAHEVSETGDPTTLSGAIWPNKGGNIGPFEV